MGLKYTNSFWNPRYYDHLRPTLTKQILYISGQQLVDEVRPMQLHFEIALASLMMTFLQYLFII